MLKIIRENSHEEDGRKIVILSDLLICAVRINSTLTTNESRTIKFSRKLLMVGLPAKDCEGHRKDQSLDTDPGAESVKRSVVLVSISGLGDG